MKASEFKAVIRQLVIEEVEREVHREVSKQLPKLLFEMLGQKPNTSNQTTLVKEDISSDPDVPSIQKKVQPQIPQKKVIKKYVKDPVLNAILNETTPGLPQTGIDVGVPIPAFSKIGVSKEFIGEMKEILNESTSIPENTVQTESPIQETIEESPTVGTDLSKLFNKNFKAILEQSKKGHSGNFSGAIQSW